MPRTFPSIAIKIWMDKLQKGASLSSKALINLLSCMSDEEAKSAVEDAIWFGILKLTSKGRRYTLVQEIDDKIFLHLYCFECHLPEPGLLKCHTCARCYHEDCWRHNPEVPNYVVPSGKGQTHRLPSSESDSEEDHIDDNQEMLTNPESTIETNNNNTFETSFNENCDKNFVIKCEKEDDEIEFVCETPARARSRKEHESIKSEPPNQVVMDRLAEETTDKGLCTACRLLKMRQIKNPPYMSQEELRYLLEFSWKSYRSWIKQDVRKYMKNWTDNDVALVKHILFPNDILGLSDITKKLSSLKYSYLMEFLVDLLDLQYNIAVFFGVMSEEYRLSKFLIRDITYDIKEICVCSDCFRHSNEANKSSIWFAKPCVNRHELVYAKYKNNSYWPAKVIRVSSKSIYDVRFFGGKHTRSLVSVSDIKYEYDMVKGSRGLSAALKELTYFHALKNLPSNIFAYHADPTIADSIISNALSPFMEANELKAPKRRHSMKPAAITPATIALRQQPKRLHASFVESPTTNPNETTLIDEANSSKLALELSKIQKELSRCKAQLSGNRKTTAELKRTRWCYVCMKKARFQCCFSAAYCSKACNMRDKRRHRVECHKKK